MARTYFTVVCRQARVTRVRPCGRRSGPSGPGGPSRRGRRTGVGDQRKSLDLSLEDPDGGRPAVIDRQAEFGAQVDDLAARVKAR